MFNCGIFTSQKKLVTAKQKQDKLARAANQKQAKKRCHNDGRKIDSKRPKTTLSRNNDIQDKSSSSSESELNESESSGSESAPTMEDLSVLGAMDRYKVLKAAKKGKSEAKREFNAALERTQAMQEAKELAYERRKRKDKVHMLA